MAVIGKAIRIFLVEGTPTGLHTAEIGNWTGKVLVCPRHSLVKMKDREEANRPGIYVLSGVDPERPNRDMVYIGESDNVFNRLLQHAKNEKKDFWRLAAVVTSKDENLTKAHSRYLESRLIALTIAAKRATLFNTNSPPLPSLPEADIADMEYFLNQVRLVMPVLGFKFAEPVGRRKVEPQSDKEENPEEQATQFEMNSVGAKALAQETEGAFVVFKGSTARKNPSYETWSSYRALRDQLVEEGKLVDSDDPKYLVFAEDVEFSSPSAAAAVVVAGAKNGPKGLKVVGTGQTYRAWQEERLNKAGVE